MIRQLQSAEYLKLSSWSCPHFGKGPGDRKIKTLVLIPNLTSNMGQLSYICGSLPQFLPEHTILNSVGFPYYAKCLGETKLMVLLLFFFP